MKKVLLLGASALALGVGSNAAFADDPLKVTLSGTGQEWFGYASNKKSDVGNYSSTFAQSNNSFSLNGSTKLDNGITVSVSLTMNASPGGEGSNAHMVTTGGPNGSAYTPPTGSPETDFVSIAGSFGSVALGYQPNAAVGTGLDGPSFGVGGLTWGRWAGWVNGPAGNNLIAGSGVTSVYDDYWANKVVYSTPSLAGFQGTVSFTPNMASTDTGSAASGVAGGWGGDSTSVALSYGGDLGAAKIKAQVAYTSEEFKSYTNTAVATGFVPGAHLNGYQGGINATFGGFTVGGALADREISDSAGTALAQKTLKTDYSTGITWDVGVSYTTGPWGIAASYYTSQADNNNLTGTTSGDENNYYYGVSFQYTLGPGITLDLENAIVTYKIDPGAATAANVNKNNGWFSVLSTTVNF